MSTDNQIVSVQFDAYGFPMGLCDTNGLHSNLDYFGEGRPMVEGVFELETTVATCMAVVCQTLGALVIQLKK